MLRERIARWIVEVEPALADHLASWWATAVTLDGGAPPVRPLPAAVASASSRRLLARAMDVDGRARPWWRLAIAAAVEADARVRDARDAPIAWAGLGALAAAREQAARALGFGGYWALARAACGIHEDVLRLARPRSGAGSELAHDERAAPLPAVPALPACAPERLREVLVELGRRTAVDVGAVRVDRGREARTFVIAPGRDVRIVASENRTLASWRTALHEVGHGLAGATGLWPARASDEAAATWAADRLASADEAAWILGLDRAGAAIVAAHAVAARQSRRRAADFLAGFEASIYAAPGGDLRARWEAGVAAGGWARAWPAPPEALWRDPGAQAAYLAGEDRARHLDAALAAGASFATALGRIDGPAAREP